MDTDLRPTVLVVDDDPDVRDAFAEIFEREGFHVYTASDGQTAMQRLETEPRPAVVILDLYMPGFNGWNFRLAQRDNAVVAEIPVIIVTGADASPLTPELQGSAGVLRKPVDIKAMIAMVHRLIGEAAPIREMAQTGETVLSNCTKIEKLAEGMGFEPTIHLDSV